MNFDIFITDDPQHKTRAFNGFNNRRKGNVILYFVPDEEKSIQMVEQKESKEKL